MQLVLFNLLENSVKKQGRASRSANNVSGYSDAIGDMTVPTCWMQYVQILFILHTVTCVELPVGHSEFWEVVLILQLT